MGLGLWAELGNSVKKNYVCEVILLVTLLEGLFACLIVDMAKILSVDLRYVKLTVQSRWPLMCLKLYFHGSWDTGGITLA